MAAVTQDKHFIGIFLSKRLRLSFWKVNQAAVGLYVWGLSRDSGSTYEERFNLF